jgi:nitrite reductase (NADH) large subunit
VTRYLIIGNGAAGVTAAEQIRRRDLDGSIVIVSAEKYPMYSRPGLAYVVINEIPEGQVIARQPEWYRQLRLEWVHGTAAGLDVRAKTVRLAGGSARPYDKLLIATGARAVPLPYPGADLEGIVYLDTLDGTRELLRRARRARRAVVVGGGITALEMAEGFAQQKVETHYFVRRDTLWSTVFNAAESKLLAEHMAAHGVRLHFNTEITEVLGNGRGQVTGVRLKNGTVFPCDVVGAGIGVKPQLDLVQGTGIRVDRAILVNEFLETNVPDIYAAGDCTQVWDRWTKRHTADVLWPSAIAAGGVAGRNMAGAREAYVKGTPFNACLLFGLHITAIGQLGTREAGDEQEVVQHMSRGSSEVWSSRPHAYASAWSQNGPDTLRLSLSGNRLVGALVVGNQVLADPLRDLIERQADVGPLRPYLAQGGPQLAQRVHDYWRLVKMEGRRRMGASTRPTQPRRG